jgi:hypothetical protein
MDPFAIFYDVHELITQHFDYDEIFEYSVVSKLWYELILHNSKFAMRKIKLHVKESNTNEIYDVFDMKISEVNENLFNILKCTRKYQNIQIDVDHEWDFTDELIRSLSHSLVDIKLSSDVYLEDIKIPTLMYLTIDNPLLEGLTTCSTSLRKLSASVSGKIYWLKKESPSAIRNAMQKNCNLEILELDDVLVEGIFHTDISHEMKFELRELSLNCTLNLANESIVNNIKKFLLSQNQLQVIHLSSIDDSLTQWIYENLPNLQSLSTTIHFEDTNPRRFQLTTHKSLIRLDINITANWQFTTHIKYAFRTVIGSMPNLEVLVLRMLSPLDFDDLRFLIFHAVKLKKMLQSSDDCLQTYRDIYQQMQYDHENLSPQIEFSKAH